MNGHTVNEWVVWRANSSLLQPESTRQVHWAQQDNSNIYILGVGGPPPEGVGQPKTSHWLVLLCCLVLSLEDSGPCAREPRRIFCGWWATGGSLTGTGIGTGVGAGAGAGTGTGTGTGKAQAQAWAKAQATGTGGGFFHSRVLCNSLSTLAGRSTHVIDPENPPRSVPKGPYSFYWRSGWRTPAPFEPFWFQLQRPT